MAYRHFTPSFLATPSLLVATLAFVALLPGAKGNGCGDDDVSIGDDNGPGNGGGGASSSENINQQSVIGQCGTGEGPGYCDAEVLRWNYEAASERLTLEDRRMELNCCGDRTWVIQKDGDRYVATETDAPELVEGQESRCDCMCVFDFTLVADGIPDGTINLDIVRDVTDSTGDPLQVFSGALDLTTGSGEVIVDETPATFCGQG